MTSRGRAWPVAITGILATVVGVNIWVAMLAARDPSFAIEPDYYRKAVAWDSAMAQAEHNAALRWTLTPVLGGVTRDGHATLAVRLVDATGATISGADVRVTALHVARANAEHRAQLNAGDDNAYRATLNVNRAGQWELRFDVTRGTDRFTQVSRVQAVLDGTP